MARETRTIVNLTRGTVVCERAWLADSVATRMRGLLGCSALAPGSGLLIRPAPSVHTAFMRFAIDAVFLDRGFRVVKVVPELRPWRLAGARGARAVLELAAGETRERGLCAGDVVADLDAPEPVLPHNDGLWGEPRLVGELHTALRTLNGCAANGTAGYAGQAAGDAEVKRVVVAATDRRFRAVASALLTGRGWVVSVTSQLSDTAELAKRERATVVLLEAGAALTAAALTVAQIEALRPPVGVVVVGDDPPPELSSLPVHPRWGSFDRICRALEAAASERRPLEFER